ncbi:preprotein translocase subunit SecG [Desulfoscipio geothermicus]|uniref:Protein-export membrane protein SecG n=1 Tax=Desulfoscipio geothermicus DSM 3669 TaxID=1121426 RepID=A0A1I6DD42_9FIRM|nr:preprotein translocase subunit SecG [Desulfoscipio geothermicus]SFR03364.1 preprotein translocase subunit SecG [Desulfoscipio geothermicus DSM 3669]
MVAKVILTVLHVLFSLGLIAVILLQSGKSAGLSGAIAGGAETFFGKKKGLDELLGKITVYMAIAFAATSLVLVVLSR